MPQAEQCSTEQLQQIAQQHTDMDTAICGKLRPLTLDQKKTLMTKIEKWLSNL